MKSGATKTTSCCYTCPSPCAVKSVSGEFPVGLRVLVVDDDTTCLRILEKMLRKCLYHVTTCGQATNALSLLRKRKGFFDVVISDVHMPDMDGFKLLEHVGLEMDLPVIMMSADGRTSAVMKGIKHGACDYLIKPVRVEELKNIWQHVIRKKGTGVRDVEQSGSLEETSRYEQGRDVEQSGSVEETELYKQGGGDIEYSSSANEGAHGTWKVHKKRKEAKEEDEGDLDNDDPSTFKKPRVVWSIELHQQFVSAVNQLGIEKAVPKRILELMNVPGLTRENVASHLQKFRLYLKRLSGLAQQHSGYGPGESNAKLAPLSGIDIQALAASGQIPPQTLADLHAEFFGRPTGSLVLSAKDKSLLLQASLQGVKHISVERHVAFGHPIAKGQLHMSKKLPQSSILVEDGPSGFGTWLPKNLSAIDSIGHHIGVDTQNDNLLRQVLQQQQQHPNSSHTINVQPSCVVAPSQSLRRLQAGNISSTFDQSPIFGSVALTDYSFHSSQSHDVSGGLEEVRNSNIINIGVHDGYCLPGSISSRPSCSRQSASVPCWQVQNSTVNSSATRRFPEPNMLGVQGVSTSTRDDLLYQVPDNNSGFVGKGTSLPVRYALDEFESPMSNFSHGKIFGDNDGGKVKQNVTLDFTESAKFGIPVMQQFSPNDLTSVL